MNKDLRDKEKEILAYATDKKDLEVLEGAEENVAPKSE